MPVAFEGQAPDRPADAGGVVVEVSGRTGCDQPAGGGRARLGGAGLAEKQAHDAAVAGAEREAATRRQVEFTRVAAKLGEHGGKAGAAQPFLEDPERFPRPAGGDDHQTGRIETEMIEARTVREAALAGDRCLDDPEDRATVADGEPGE